MWQQIKQSDQHCSKKASPVKSAGKSRQAYYDCVGFISDWQGGEHSHCDWLNVMHVSTNKRTRTIDFGRHGKQLYLHI